MTTEEMERLFREHEETDYIKFEFVENRRSQRPDMHAFLLLDSIVPGDKDIVGDAQHDEIYLSVGDEELAEKITPEQVLELVRCGVRHGEYGLCMFV